MQYTAEIKVRDAQAPLLARIPRRNGHDRAHKVNLTPARDLKADLAKTTAGIVAKCGDPARVLEFYYWSRQQGLADLIRAFGALPTAMRTTLGGFLSEESDADLVVTKKGGRLTLLRTPRRKGG